MPLRSVRAIHTATHQAVPLHHLKEACTSDLTRDSLLIDCFESGLRVGEQIVYDGSVKIGAPKIVNVGAQFLGRVRWYAITHLDDQLRSRVDESFEELFADSRISGSVYERILRVHLDNSERERWSHPEFSEDLANVVFH